MKPKYQLNDRVFHLGRKATITCLVNFDDPSDLRLQGPRYYVFHSGYQWSVPEAALEPVTTRK
jgi:hypothetical protein